MNKYLKSLGKNASKAFNHKINTNLKNKVLIRTNGLTKYSNWRNSLRKEQLKQRLEVDPSKVKYGLILLAVC